MAEAHRGDAALCGSILNAKKTSDFSSLILQNGDTPQNLRQLKKDVLSQEIKSLTNLGAIVSGRALNCSDNNANPGNHNPHGGNPIINGGNTGHGNGNSGGTSHGQGHSPVMVIR